MYSPNWCWSLKVPGLASASLRRHLFHLNHFSSAEALASRPLMRHCQTSHQRSSQGWSFQGWQHRVRKARVSFWTTRRAADSHRLVPHSVEHWPAFHRFPLPLVHRLSFHLSFEYHLGKAVFVILKTAHQIFCSPDLTEMTWGHCSVACQYQGWNHCWRYRLQP